MRNERMRQILGNCDKYSKYVSYRDKPEWRQIGVVDHRGIYRHKSGYTYRVGSPSASYTYTAEGMRDWLLNGDNKFTGGYMAAIELINS